ncbi:MAG: hypothetical protein EXR70_09860 [Deltaproteobacteria bacterium]|nr:hypothetical protein [Deltaproteobacteria bacterium]
MNARAAKNSATRGTTRLCVFYRDLLKKSHPSVRETNARSFLVLQRDGVKNYATLLKRLDFLPKEKLRTAFEILGLTGKRAVVPTLLEMLQQVQTDRGSRFDIRNALATLGGQRAFKGLVRVLNDQEQLPETRFEACHGLAHQWFGLDPAIFFAVVKDRTNDPHLRGQAVEGIAIHGNYIDRRRRSRRATTEVLLDCLDDAEAEVRFWGVFGVNCFGLKQALPKLCKLSRSDHAVAALGWSVAEEAKDAIFVLTKGYWPEPDAFGRRNDAKQARKVSNTESKRRRNEK